MTDKVELLYNTNNNNNNKKAIICISYQLQDVPVAVGWHERLNIYRKLRGGNTAKTCLCPEHAHSQVLIGWPAGTGRAEEVPAKHPHPGHPTLPFDTPQSYFISCQFSPSHALFHIPWFSTTCAKSPGTRVTNSGCGTERERLMHLCYSQLLWIQWDFGNTLRCHMCSIIIINTDYVFHQWCIVWGTFWLGGSPCCYHRHCISYKLFYRINTNVSKPKTKQQQQIN